MANPSKSQPPKPPKGTRDLYPDDLLKRRYIQNAWRDASLRCGFDEIEGPTFESTDLYSIKSGQGILNELFQTFSGKGGQETLDKLVERGQADFALRPEFTPTLARMYAARAKQLPKPCKWFTAGPYFRAERPQRGRLREFLQWNCDIIGLPSDEDTPQTRAQMDAEIIESCVVLLNMLGLKFGPNDIYIRKNNRVYAEYLFTEMGVDPINMAAAFDCADRAKKVGLDQTASSLSEFGCSVEKAHALADLLVNPFIPASDNSRLGTNTTKDDVPLDFQELASALVRIDIQKYTIWDRSIVRGLAYYTGTVFEAIADGERAVAGGGRYDNLIELMGGPKTPAVGFAMGDVVLGNLLDDKQLMPEGQDLMEAVSRKQTSIRPEAFIAVPNNDEENKSAAQSLTAALRRGQESEAYLAREDRKPWQADRYTTPPLHTRISYKSTTNPGKLRKDAEKQHAKYFIEIHAPNKVELTDMDKREPITSSAGSFSVNPASENYIGTALANLTK